MLKKKIWKLQKSKNKGFFFFKTFEFWLIKFFGTWIFLNIKCYICKGMSKAPNSNIFPKDRLKITTKKRWRNFLSVEVVRPLGVHNHTTFGHQSCHVSLYIFRNITTGKRKNQLTRGYVPGVTWVFTFVLFLSVKSFFCLPYWIITGFPLNK